MDAIATSPPWPLDGETLNTRARRLRLIILRYALDILVPQLKNATDGGPATAVTDLSNAA